MKKITLLLICFATLGTCPLGANPRSRVEARNIARQNAESIGRQLAAAPGICRSIGLSASDSIQCYYAFNHADNQGFTLVSGDDRMPEIIGYTDQGSFSTEGMPDGLKFYLECYAQTYRAVTSGNESAASRVIRKTAAKTAIAPMVKCHWAQNEPYNLSCPVTDGQRTLTGCVATALAQILYYHKNPDIQMVDIPGYGSIPSITGNRTYDWDKMLETYTSGYTPDQANAVSKLMYHCGVALNMSYGTSVSTTYSQNIPSILKYFGMADGAKAVNASDYKTTDEWLAVLDNELENARPVVVWGYSSTCGGHSFLSSGRNATGLYHINWGWGNNNWTAEGYYDMTVLAPGLPDTEGYHNNCGLIIGIQRAEGNAVALQRMNLVLNQLSTDMNKYRSGTTPGYVEAVAYQQVQDAITQAKAIVADSGSGMTGEEIDAKTLALKQMVADLYQHVIPFTDGYYYVKSTKTNSGTSLAMKSILGEKKYGLLQSEASYLWRLAYDSDTYSYTFVNAAYGSMDSDPTATEMRISPSSYSAGTGFYYSIRDAAADENSYLGISGTASEGDLTKGSLSTSGSTGTGPGAGPGQQSTTASATMTWTLQSVDNAVAEDIINTTKAQYEYAILTSRVEPLLAKANSALTNIGKDAEQKTECQAEADALQQVVDKRPETYTQEYYMQLLIAYSALAAKYVDSNILQDYCNQYKTYSRHLVKGRGEGTNDQYKVALFEAALYALQDSLSSGAVMTTARQKEMRDELFNTYDAAILSYRPYTGRYDPEPGTPQYRLNYLVSMVDSICEADMPATVKNSTSKTVSFGTKYSSPFTDAGGDKVSTLLNGGSTTWKSVAADTVPTCYHYVQMTLNSAYEGVAQLSTQRASTGYNQVTRFGIMGSVDNQTWTDICEVEVPCDAVSETKKVPFMLYSPEAEGAFKYLRIYFNRTTSDNGYAEITQLSVNKPGTAFTDDANRILTLYKASSRADEISDATEDDVKALSDAIRDYTGVEPVIPTGIEEMQNAECRMQSSDYYNLAGRRLTAPEKGINIIHGKKIYIMTKN